MPRRPRRSAPTGGSSARPARRGGGRRGRDGDLRADRPRGPGSPGRRCRRRRGRPARRCRPGSPAMQQPDGGYALGGLAGVETPEAVLALRRPRPRPATCGATGRPSTASRRCGARDGGPSVLEALSALARSTTSATDAALLVTRVALPLGLDPTSFDPANQGRPVDLVALLGRTDADRLGGGPGRGRHGPRGAPGDPAPEDQVTAILDARLEDGSWAEADGVAGDGRGRHGLGGRGPDRGRDPAR